ncbi:hypothetical protein HHK36_006883 [Tetracentron sinense]|uniref:F-box domain-containing protein n=1 Tax=Tetracentron sinense TaxID=13715 RepID=A0A835DKR8_TETSI|nr:hypothetical protein HHK36_006883 [Tetracentron sinense]
MEMRLNPGSDIISNLPEQVIETILVHLPIGDAVRTSVLSQKWRYNWTTIPELVFDDNSIPPPVFDENHILTAQDVTIRMHKIVNFIDRVLLLHKGPVHKFEFSTLFLKDSFIDAWILFLSRNGVKELTINYRGEKYYRAPYSFFSCQAINCLNLLYCILEPPSVFKGFSHLKSLNLHSVTLSDEVLETIISNCIALERLRLIELRGCTRLKIWGLNLQHFDFQGELTHICFLDAPRLSFVSIFSDDWLLEHVGQGDSCNFVQVLGPLTGLEKLATNDNFMKSLAFGNLLARLPVTFDRLKSISLVMNFEDLNETLVMLCLLQSSPNLHELEIVHNDNDFKDLEEDFWEAQGHLDCSMNHLRVVRVSDIVGIQPELQFMKFLLANSPVLEILSVIPRSEIIVDKTMIMKELLRFQRASVIAEIVYTPNLSED